VIRKKRPLKKAAFLFFRRSEIRVVKLQADAVTRDACDALNWNKVTHGK